MDSNIEELQITNTKLKEENNLLKKRIDNLLEANMNLGSALMNMRCNINAEQLLKTFTEIVEQIKNANEIMENYKNEQY